MSERGDGVLENGFGFLVKAKWAIVQKAPLTASGLNEIIAMAPTKAELYKITVRRQFGPTSMWEIVKVEDMEAAMQLRLLVLNG